MSSGPLFFEESQYNNYYSSQSLLTFAAKSTNDEKERGRLELMALHAFSKVSSFSVAHAKKLGFQLSPFLAGSGRYHRIGLNPLLFFVYNAYAKALGYPKGSTILVHSEQIVELFSVARRVEKWSDCKQVISNALKSKRGSHQPIVINLLNTQVDAKKLSHLCKEFEKESALSRLVVLMKYKGKTLFYLPQIDLNFRSALLKMIQVHGHCLGPIEAKEAWLLVEPLESILRSVQLTVKPPFKGDSTVSMTLESLLKDPIVKPFSEVAGPLGRATLALLDLKLPNRDWIPHSLTRIRDAMERACKEGSDPIVLYNQIERVHQEIQTLLSLTRPYKRGELEDCVSRWLGVGASGYAKPSAMRCLSDVISSVKAQKGEKAISIARQSELYFESREMAMVELSSTTGKIDLFLCEFHHNFTPNKTKYEVERVVDQIKDLDRSEQFTVAIDMTLDLEASPELFALMKDQKITSWLESGRMNLVVYRSAQKFDMFGMDNYYGGLAAVRNKRDEWLKFNHRMGRGSLQGLSYQGLAHLKIKGGKLADEYRKEILSNTWYLYNKLPSGMKDPKASLFVAKIQEGHAFFLDIALAKDATPLAELLETWAQEKRFPVTKRQSFGFLTTNFVLIGRSVRLTPGLHRPTLDQIATLFKRVVRPPSR